MTAPIPPARFLSAENRLAKIPLADRAAQCTADIRTALGTEPPDLALLGQGFNRGSLAMAMAGDLEEAERACRRQIRTVLGLVRSGRAEEAGVAFALQPWINIGRLRVIQGRWEEALDHFRPPEHYLDSPAVSLNGSDFGAGELQALRSEGKKVRAFLAGSHIVETAKACLRGDRFDLLVRHLRGRPWSRSAPGAAHVREGLVIAAFRTPGAGREDPEEDYGDEANPRRTVLRIQAALGWRLLGRTKEAEYLTAAVAEDLADLPAFGTSLPDRLTVLRAAADLCRGHGFTAAAEHAYTAAEEIAAETGDEIELHAILNARASLGVPSPRFAPDHSRRIAERSDHFVLRRQAGRAEPLRAADHPRLRELLETMRAAEHHALGPGSAQRNTGGVSPLPYASTTGGTGGHG